VAVAVPETPALGPEVTREIALRDDLGRHPARAQVHKERLDVVEMVGDARTRERAGDQVALEAIEP
jgi:hypothetical protein